MQRPSGNNADEWNLWLCYWLQGPTQDDAVPSAYLAVQIVEALASARAEGWKAGRDAAAKVARERAAEWDKCGKAGQTMHEQVYAAGKAAECDHIAIDILALEEPRHE